MPRNFKKLSIKNKKKKNYMEIYVERWEVISTVS
jgi:hypothetical protein